MRITLLLATLVVALSHSPAFAQNPAPSNDNDGGISYDNRGQELLESINVPNIPNAPFSLTLSTEWSRPQGNGGTFTVANVRPIKRDRAGRIYMERWTLSPKGSGIRSRMSWMQIVDPVANTYYACTPIRHYCDLAPAHPDPRGPDPALAHSGTLQGNKGTHTHEDFGKQSFAGLLVESYRETTTLNPGVLGNSLPMVTVREFFYSRELGINLRSSLDTPSVGRQLFTVTEIDTNDPDPKFFLPPEGYKIIDHRQPSPDKN